MLSGASPEHPARPGGNLPGPRALLLALFAGLALPLDAAEREEIVAGRFSALEPGTPLTHGWKNVSLSKNKKPTAYSLSREETVCVKAVSDNSASLFLREIQVNPREHPILRWRWKATGLIPEAQVHRKGKDDAPARLYVAFHQGSRKPDLVDKTVNALARFTSGFDLPYATLVYVWDNTTLPGTLIPNNYTRRIQAIVVESGPANLNKWIDYQRNLYQDYKKAFDEEPPPVGAVAVMTDSDNTQGQATTYFGDIAFMGGTIPPPEMIGR